MLLAADTSDEGESDHNDVRSCDTMSRSHAERRSSSSGGPAPASCYKCPARSLDSGHHSATLSFLNGEGVHGAGMICSSRACADTGRRFKYCAVCKIPVSARNFRRRHGDIRIAHDLCRTRSGDAARPRRPGGPLGWSPIRSDAAGVAACVAAAAAPAAAAPPPVVQEDSDGSVSAAEEVDDDDPASHPAGEAVASAASPALGASDAKLAEHVSSLEARVASLEALVASLASAAAAAADHEAPQRKRPRLSPETSAADSKRHPFDFDLSVALAR